MSKKTSFQIKHVLDHQVTDPVLPDLRALINSGFKALGATLNFDMSWGNWMGHGICKSTYMDAFGGSIGTRIERLVHFGLLFGKTKCQKDYFNCKLQFELSDYILLGRTLSRSLGPCHAGATQWPWLGPCAAGVTPVDCEGGSGSRVFSNGPFCPSSDCP